VDGPVAQYRRWFRQFYSTWTSPTDHTRAIGTDSKSANSQQTTSG
jgi:hypothetical protein